MLKVHVYTYLLRVYGTVVNISAKFGSAVENMSGVFADITTAVVATNTEAHRPAIR